MKIKVCRDGVRLNDQWYYHPKLRLYVGYELSVKPVDDETAAVYDPDGNVLCEAKTPVILTDRSPESMQRAREIAKSGRIVIIASAQHPLKT